MSKPKYPLSQMVFFTNRIDLKAIVLVDSSNKYTCILGVAPNAWNNSDKSKLEELTKSAGEWFINKSLSIWGTIPNFEYYKFNLSSNKVAVVVKEVQNLLKSFSKLVLIQFHYDKGRINIHEHFTHRTVHALGKNHKKVMKNYLLRLQGCDLLTDVEENDYRVKFKLTSKAKANLLESFQAIADLCPGTIVW